MEEEMSSRADRDTEQKLLTQAAVLVELAKSEQLGKGDFRSFSRLATETSADMLSVARVGVWLFSEDRSVLHCREQYEAASGLHTSGAELESHRYPRYFAALEAGRTVAAHDAINDPATKEFRDSYLRPQGITSMLDAPLRWGGQLMGVVCHEHVGPIRTWSAVEQEFAASVADFVSLAFEGHERRRAEQAFRVAQEQLLRQQWQARQQVESELDRAKGEVIRKTRLAAIGQVASSIAHELRNPLGAIRNAQFYLKRHVPESEPKWVEYLGIIEQEIHTANGIVGNLLEASRAKEPQKEPLDLGQAVQKAFSRVKGLEKIQLRLTLDPEPFEISADPDQLQQVLINLITNSSQALQGEGSISIRAKRDEVLNTITLADDGPGISASVSERIFEPLFTTRSKGTGLGLTICRQIVERHGWTLELLEVGERGATFRIQLPRRSPI